MDPERLTILSGLGSEYIATTVEKEYPNYPWHLDLYIEYVRAMDSSTDFRSQHKFFMYIQGHLVNEAKKYILPRRRGQDDIVSMEGFRRLSEMGAIGPYVLIDDRLYPVFDPELTKVKGITPTLDNNVDTEHIKLMWCDTTRYVLDGLAHSFSPDFYYPVQIAYDRYGVYDPYISYNHNPHMFGYDSPQQQQQTKSELLKYTRDNIHKLIFGRTLTDRHVINHIKLLNRSFNLQEVFKRIELWKYTHQQLSYVSDSLALYIHQKFMDGSIFGMSLGHLTCKIRPHPDRLDTIIEEITPLLPRRTSVMKESDGSICVCGRASNDKLKLIISMMYMYCMVTDRIDPNLWGVGRYKAYKYNIPIACTRSFCTQPYYQMYDKYGVTQLPDQQ